MGGRGKRQQRRRVGLHERLLRERINTGTLSDSHSFSPSLSPTLCGQLMSLKASPLLLSAQNQMNPLTAKLKCLTAHQKSVLFFFGKSQIHSYCQVAMQGSGPRTSSDYIAIHVGENVLLDSNAK